MSKEKSINVLILAAAIGIAGLILLVFNVSFGMSLAERWLMNRGGSDTATYNIILDSYIHTFLMIGSLLFGFSLLLSMVAFVKREKGVS